MNEKDELLSTSLHEAIIWGHYDVAKLLIEHGADVNVRTPLYRRSSITEEAQRQGTTPELLALDSLRKLFGPAPASEEPTGEDATLFNFLAGHIGTVDGAVSRQTDGCSRCVDHRYR